MKANLNIPAPVRIVTVEMSEPEAIILRDCIGNSSPGARKRFFGRQTEIENKCVFLSLYQAIDTCILKDDEL